MAFPQDWAAGRVCELTLAQAAGNLSAFPVVITGASLPAEMLDSGDPNCALDGGGDIRFSSDRDGLNQLACDIRAFHTAAGGVGAYAEIVVKTNLSGTATTTVYVWYHVVGKTQPGPTDLYGQYNAYDANFLGVWALNEDPGPGVAGDILDRTSNIKHGTADASFASDDLVDGNLNKAIRFADEKITTPSINLPTAHTHEALFNPTTITGWGLLVAGGDNRGLFHFSSPNELRELIKWSTATGLTISTGSWHYAASAVESTDAAKIQLDASVYDLSAPGELYGGNVAHTFGKGTAAYPFDGLVDEVRISDIARSANWRSATYNNLLTPGTFTTAGTPEDATEPAVCYVRWRQFDMGERQISSTTRPVLFFMADATDLVTGEAGLTPAVTISKNGGSFAGAAGTVSEVGAGWYALAGNATDRDTLGELAIHATGTGAAPFDAKLTIVTHDPFDIATGNATLAMQNTIDGKLDDVMGTGFVTGTHSLDQVSDIATVVDAVCDENIVAAHGTANSVGLILRALGAQIATRSNNPTLNDLLGVPDQVGATVVSEAGGGGSTSSPELLHSTSLATVSSQTTMTLTSGSTDDDAYTSCLVVFTDQSTSTQKSVARVLDYVGATRSITLVAAPTFVVVAGDSIDIVADTAAVVSTASVAAIEDAILNDDATVRTTANSVGKAINALTTLAARTNNPNLNALLGVADQAGLTAVRSVYFCRFQFIQDNAAARDEYRSIRWYKDDTPLDSGVTDAKIRLINADTGTDVIAESALSEAGTSHLFYYNAVDDERIVDGQAYAVRFKATIDGQVRVFEDRIGRDAAA